VVGLAYRGYELLGLGPGSRVCLTGLEQGLLGGLGGGGVGG